MTELSSSSNNKLENECQCLVVRITDGDVSLRISAGVDFGRVLWFCHRLKVNTKGQNKRRALFNKSWMQKTTGTNENKSRDQKQSSK